MTDIIETIALAICGPAKGAAQFRREVVDLYGHQAARVLQALEREGYVVRPKEPTEAMIAAAWAVMGYDGDISAAKYRAMIAAFTAKPATGERA